LILGTSRAAQAIEPSILKQILKKDFYNFAFTNAHSPYGPVYFNSIKKKLNKDSKESIFIVCVNPWSLSSKRKSLNDSNSFREKNLILANMSIYSQNPNFDYLINAYKGWYANIIKNKFSDEMILNEYGRLEVNIRMDSVSVEKRTDNKIKSYSEDIMPEYVFSELRYLFLIKTIKFLNEFGEVYLVRLPVHKRMKEIEDQYMPDFNNIILKIEPFCSAYFDFSNEYEKYNYTDGNHIERRSGDIISKEIAYKILQKRSPGN